MRRWRRVSTPTDDVVEVHLARGREAAVTLPRRPAGRQELVPAREPPRGGALRQRQQGEGSRRKQAVGGDRVTQGTGGEATEGTRHPRRHGRPTLGRGGKLPLRESGGGAVDVGRSGAPAARPSLIGWREAAGPWRLAQVVWAVSVTDGRAWPATGGAPRACRPRHRDGPPPVAVTLTYTTPARAHNALPRPLTRITAISHPIQMPRGRRRAVLAAAGDGPGRGATQGREGRCGDIHAPHGPQWRRSGQAAGGVVPVSSRGPRNRFVPVNLWGGETEGGGRGAAGNPRLRARINCLPSSTTAAAATSRAAAGRGDESRRREGEQEEA